MCLYVCARVHVATEVAGCGGGWGDDGGSTLLTQLGNWLCVLESCVPLTFLFSHLLHSFHLRGYHPKCKEPLGPGSLVQCLAVPGGIHAANGISFAHGCQRSFNVYVEREGGGGGGGGEHCSDDAHNRQVSPLLLLVYVFYFKKSYYFI